MMELWGRKNAYNVQKVLWLLAELKLEYRHHDVGSQPGELETAAFLQMNPHARIPVLVRDGATIWESNSILRYLAASFDGGRLLPAELLLRSFVERWMDWELASLQPDFIELFWQYYRTPPRKQDKVKITQAQQRCAQRFQQLDQQLADRDYLAGDYFSLADICCGTCLYRYFTLELEIDKPPNVLNWYQRLSQRDAFQQNIMVDYTELKGRKTF